MSRFQQYLCTLFLMFLSMAFVILVSGCATTGQYAEPLERPTISCPEGTRVDLRQGVCNSVCTEGMKFDPATKGCVSVCGSGFRWSQSHCVSVCTGETTWDGVNLSCACPSGKFSTENGLCFTKAEMEAQLEKMEAAAVERAAILRAQIEAERNAPPKARRCKLGTDWDIFTQQCVSICLGGTWDEKQATCLCPPGQQWNRFHTRCEVPQLPDN